jgi:hypothetical protein
MRDELVQAIRERTGFDEAVIQQVLTVAVEFISQRVPPEMAPMLAMVLGGAAPSGEGTAPAPGEGGAAGLPDLNDLLGGLMQPRGS